MEHLTSKSTLCKTASKGLTHSLSSLIYYGHNSHKSVEKLALAQPYANFGETSMQLYRKAFYRPFQWYNIHPHHTKPSYCICLAFLPIFFCESCVSRKWETRENVSNLLMHAVLYYYVEAFRNVVGKCFEFESPTTLKPWTEILSQHFHLRRS